jgi:hypothetical protein
MTMTMKILLPPVDNAIKIRETGFKMKQYERYKSNFLRLYYPINEIIDGALQDMEISEVATAIYAACLDSRSARSLTDELLNQILQAKGRKG